MTVSQGISQSAESFFVDKKVSRGWKTVIAGTIGLVFGPSTMTILTFGIFVKPLQQEFGWTVGQTTLAITILSYVLILISIAQGMLVDRFGSRIVIITCIPVFVAAYSSLYFLPNNLYLYYAWWVFIACCAVGLWPVSYLRATSTWFDRHLGLSLGITNAGIGIGSVIIPPLGSLLITTYGWRLAYVGLAAVALVVTWPLTLLMLRDNTASSRTAAKSTASVAVGVSVGEAMRTSTYVITSGVFVILGALCSGLIVLQIPMLIESGVSPVVAAGLASVTGVAMIFGRIGTGWLLDRYHVARVMMCFILASSFAALSFAVGIRPETAPLAAALIGLIIGAEFDALSYLIPRYFGRRSFGKIYASIYAFNQLGGGFGVAAIGFSRDALGSYRPSMWVIGVLVFLSGLVFSRLGEYKYQPNHIPQPGEVAATNAA